MQNVSACHFLICFIIFYYLTISENTQMTPANSHLITQLIIQINTTAEKTSPTRHHVNTYRVVLKVITSRHSNQSPPTSKVPVMKSPNEIYTADGRIIDSVMCSCYLNYQVLYTLVVYSTLSYAYLVSFLLQLCAASWRIDWFDWHNSNIAEL